MFREMLTLQWKMSRWPLLPFLLLSFGLPLLVLRLVSEATAEAAGFGPRLAIDLMSGWGPLFPLLAALVGWAVALTAWSWDHRTGHVYALALPIPRSRYATWKFLAGAIVLLLPAACLLAGALIGRLVSPLPDGVQTYAFAITVRFLLACALTYALGFALAAGTTRTAITVALVAVGVLVFGTLLVQFLEGVLDRALLTPFELLEAALLDWPGPFHVFGGSWMLIDV